MQRRLVGTSAHHDEPLVRQRGESADDRVDVLVRQQPRNAKREAGFDTFDRGSVHGGRQRRRWRQHLGLEAVDVRDSRGDGGRVGQIEVGGGGRGLVPPDELWPEHGRNPAQPDRAAA